MSHARRRDRLEITSAADGYLVRVPDGTAVTWMNRTAYLIFQLCTGSNSDSAIANALASAFHMNWTPLVPIRAAIAELVTAGLVTPAETSPPAITRHLEIVIWAPGPAIQPEVATGILNLNNGIDSAGIPTSIVLERDRSMRSARNRAANRVVRDAGTTHLLLVDATTEAIGSVLQVGIARLVDSEHPVIGVPVPWSFPAWDRVHEAASTLPEISPLELEAYAHGYDVSFAGVPQRRAENGFIEASHCGSAAMMVQRSALERIAGSHVVTRNRGVLSQGRIFTDPGWGFFDPAISEENIDFDEDLAFCQRVRASGGAVMIDLTGSFGTCVRVAQRMETKQ